jgi:uncharacterized protein
LCKKRVSILSQFVAADQVLRLNVGFLLKEDAGYVRQLTFAAPNIRFEDGYQLENLRGVLRASRTPQGLYFDAKFQADLPSECQRCLEPFLCTLTAAFAELFNFPPQPDSEFNIHPTGFIDLSPLLRELFILDEPISPICRPDCAGLCANCGANLNLEKCTCQKEIDPRLNKLQQLFNAPRH